MINRVRSVQPDYGNAPQSIEEIDIPEQLKQTINGHDFVLHDSGKEDSSRFIIFASQYNLELLSQHDIWFADGTFYIAPYFPNTRIGGCYFHFAKNLWANFSKKVYFVGEPSPLGSKYT